MGVKKTQLLCLFGFFFSLCETAESSAESHQADGETVMLNITNHHMTVISTAESAFRFYIQQVTSDESESAVYR